MTNQSYATPSSTAPRTASSHGALAAACAAVPSLLLACALGCTESPAPPHPQPSGADVAAALRAIDQHLTRSDTPSALLIADRLVRLVPSDPLAQDARARALLAEASRSAPERANELRRDAIAAYAAAAEADTTHAGYPHAGSVVASMVPDGELQALALAQEACRRAPADASHHLYRGLAHSRISQWDQALAAFEEANRLHPEDPTCLMSMAEVSARLGNAESALALASRARRLRPDDVDLRLMEARIARLAGSPDRTRALLLALDEVVLAREAISGELALACQQLGDHVERARAIQRSAVAQPLRFDLAIDTACAWADAGRAEEAEFWLERAGSAGAPAALLQSARDQLTEAIDRHRREGPDPSRTVP